MVIDSETVIHHPRSKVFEAYRDRLPDIAAYIPNVDMIEVVERKEKKKKGIISLHNVWHAKGDIPRVAKSFIKPDMLKWDDFADWKEKKRVCDWRLETRFFTDNIECEGRTTFEKDGKGATRVILSGELTISLEDVPGVPRMLRATLEPQVERFAVALITPNLRKVSESLEKFLDEEG